MFSIFLGISRPAAFATFFFIYKVYLMCTHITCPLDTDFNLVQPLLLSFVSNIFLVVVVVGEKETKVGQKFSSTLEKCDFNEIYSIEYHFRS